MKLDHIIRLHGPWQYEVVFRFAADGTVSQTETEPTKGTIKIPSDWSATLGRQFRGRVLYSRNFGKPTGLMPEDRVDLVFECIDAFGDVELNTQKLGPIPPGLNQTRFDITQLLEVRNRLIIAVELPQKGKFDRPGRGELPGGIIGEVRLEIFTGCIR